MAHIKGAFGVAWNEIMHKGISARVNIMRDYN